MFVCVCKCVCMSKYVFLLGLLSLITFHTCRCVWVCACVNSVCVCLGDKWLLIGVRMYLSVRCLNGSSLSMGQLRRELPIMLKLYRQRKTGGRTRSLFKLPVPDPINHYIEDVTSVTITSSVSRCVCVCVPQCVCASICVCFSVCVTVEDHAA